MRKPASGFHVYFKTNKFRHDLKVSGFEKVPAWKRIHFILIHYLILILGGNSTTRNATVTTPIISSSQNLKLNVGLP
jgi:hypothetical protein